MSTRALYTFKGETAEDTWNVYKHSDGYPTGAANVLKTALDFFAWKLPRYEADAFAGSFIAAGKCSWLWDQKFDAERFEAYGPKGRYAGMNGGNIRLMPQGDPLRVAETNCADIQYRYDVYMGNDQELRVSTWNVNCAYNEGETTKAELLLDCKLKDFPRLAKKLEKELNKKDAA